MARRMPAFRHSLLAIRAGSKAEEQLISVERKKRRQRGLFNKRLTPDEQVAQREAAFAAIKRLYCEVVPVWRACGRGYCRRHRCCIGNPGPCLKRNWPQLPPPLQDRAHEEVQAGGPRRVAAATHTEWLLRRFPPSNFTH